jgi:hypothetical protein
VIIPVIPAQAEIKTPFLPSRDKLHRGTTKIVGSRIKAFPELDSGSGMKVKIYIRGNNRLRAIIKSAQVCIDKIPVNKILNECGQIVRPSVLVIEIICVFPDINGENWFEAVRDRRVRICSFGYF